MPHTCCRCNGPVAPPRSQRWAARPRVCGDCQRAKRSSPEGRKHENEIARSFYHRHKGEKRFRAKALTNGARQRERRRNDPTIHDADRKYAGRYYRKRAWKRQQNYRRRPEVRERYRAYMQRYYRENKAKFIASAMARQRKYKRSGMGRRADWRDIRIFWVVQSGLCFWCDARLTQDSFHVDHLIPLSKGGKHERANMVLTCPTCNLRKHALLPLAFAARLRRIA